MDEQRAKVPERAKQEREIPSRWDWVEPTVWTDKMLTALEQGVKGDKWFSLIDKVYAKANLASAWKQVASNRGSAGIDNVSIQHYKRHAQQRLERTSELLKTGKYKPSGVRRVWIDKPGSKDKRPLGIPTVTDRVVQTALRNVIQPIFEKEFAECSYGFRPQRGCKDALRQVDRLIKQGYKYVVDADLKGYFDSIPQDKLKERIAERIADGRILELLQAYLSQNVVETASSWTPEAGTPQGAVISPLLANIYLNPLDWLMSNQGYKMIRYADDFVIMCTSQAEAQQALEVISEWTAKVGLTLHPEKTKVVNVDVEGFEFLGYKFIRGTKYPRTKSEQKYQDAIRQHTRRSNAHSMQVICDRLRPIQKGWFEYYKHCNSYTFKSLDSWTRRRLRSILKKRDGRRGIATVHVDNRLYPNKLLHSFGLFSLEIAHSKLCQSLT